jgi:hypothetical protein
MLEGPFLHKSTIALPVYSSARFPHSSLFSLVAETDKALIIRSVDTSSDILHFFITDLSHLTHVPGNRKELLSCESGGPALIISVPSIVRYSLQALMPFTTGDDPCPSRVGAWRLFPSPPPDARVYP